MFWADNNHREFGVTHSLAHIFENEEFLMADYAIAKFWEPLLRSNARGSKELQGWERVENPVEGFCEAPLSPMKIDGLDATDPDKAKVFLISSPGAVGKTTLARELAAKTGAILIDLSKTEPMSGNSLTGGLDKMELLERFKKGKTSVIVDGLDEGRMRVHGGDGFESFVGDVVHLVKNHANSKPIVLLGRSIAVEEAWLTLNAAGINPAVFQIDYYDADKAIEFVKLQIAVKIRRGSGPVDLNQHGYPAARKSDPPLFERTSRPGE